MKEKGEEESSPCGHDVILYLKNVLIIYIFLGSFIVFIFIPPVSRDDSIARCCFFQSHNETYEAEVAFNIMRSFQILFKKREKFGERGTHSQSPIAIT